MVFDAFKSSFNSKKRRRASIALTDIPIVRYEDTPEPTTSPTLKPSRSLRAILLPSLPGFKPMTISNFLAAGRSSSSTNLATVVEGAEPSSLHNPSLASFTSQATRSAMDILQKTRSRMAIRRKPVGLPIDPRRPSYVTKFDPQAPRQDASLHAHAREVLKKRYQSKFTFDFIPREGVSLRDYDFLWVKAGDLEEKILEDIIWVRERFAYARKDEPTDEEIIFWYNAGAFDHKKGGKLVNAESKEGGAKGDGDDEVKGGTANKKGANAQDTGEDPRKSEDKWSITVQIDE
jgi:hypothetical protein